VGAGAVWVVHEQGDTVARVSLRTGRLERRRILVSAVPLAIAAAPDGVWVVGFDNRRGLTRIDPRTSRASTQLPNPHYAAFVANGAEGLWIADYTGRVSRLDPRSGRTLAIVMLPVSAGPG
jgi:streptogramin lyase